MVCETDFGDRVTEQNRLFKYVERIQMDQELVQSNLLHDDATELARNIFESLTIIVRISAVCWAYAQSIMGNGHIKLAVHCTTAYFYAGFIVSSHFSFQFVILFVYWTTITI